MRTSKLLITLIWPRLLTNFFEQKEREPLSNKIKSSFTIKQAHKHVLSDVAASGHDS